MRVIKTVAQLQTLLKLSRKKGAKIGLVPTMGALHEGHLSLVRQARKDNEIVVVSIFVNPTQFGPKEDLKKYPRPIARDRKLLMEAGVDYLFYPPVKEMYPQGPSLYLDIDPKSSLGDLTKILCGKSRPGHFRGVLTVVAKLFTMVAPDRAYFGSKDYQQAVLIQHLIHEFRWGIDLKVLPIVRERDGLALSSRNAYLSDKEREKSLILSQTLLNFKRSVLRGNRKLDKLKKAAKHQLKKKVSKIDYFEVVDPETLRPLKKCQAHVAVLVACYVGKTRLIDNVIIRVR